MFGDQKEKPLEEIPAAQRRRPVLELGQVVGTPGALAALHEAGELGQVYLQRHRCGDWGELDADDWRTNDRALREGTRVLSAYPLLTGAKLWIITEWDRSVTTLLLPEEY
jgi:hypothetical protein